MQDTFYIEKRTREQVQELKYTPQSITENPPYIKQISVLLLSPFNAFHLPLSTYVRTILSTPSPPLPHQFHRMKSRPLQLFHYHAGIRHRCRTHTFPPTLQNLYIPSSQLRATDASSTPLSSQRYHPLIKVIPRDSLLPYCPLRRLLSIPFPSFPSS